MNARIKLTPVDTWFFRDGTPFNADESNLDISSVFPPSNRTIVGATRAALARELGWNGTAEWDDKIIERLGDRDDLSPLRYTGPRLMKSEKILFPTPSNLIKEKDGGELDFLKPREDTIRCDIGEKLVPMTILDGIKSLKNTFLTEKDFKKVLKCERPSPSDIISSDELWKEELRDGIKIDEETSTTKDDALYTTKRIRLKEGASVSMYIENAPSELKEIDSLTIGGESGMAYMDVEEIEEDGLIPPMPNIEENNGKVRFTVNFLTPTRLKNNDLYDILEQTTGATVISACIDKPIWIGGWNSLKNEPLDLEPFYSAGSVLFCEIAEKDIDKIKSLHGEKIGEYTDFGFGEIAIGKWKMED